MEGMRRFNFNTGNAPRQRVDITVLLDRSGSMSYGNATEQAVKAFADFVQDQRAQPGEATLTLRQFDNVVETVYEGRPLAEVPPLALNPRGGTALYDAVYDTFKGTIERLSALADAGTPADGAFLVVITDGQENASLDHSLRDVQGLIREIREQGWGVAFLGANEDQLAQARAPVSLGGMGLRVNSVRSYDAYASMDASGSIGAAVMSASAGLTGYRGGTGGWTGDDTDIPVEPSTTAPSLADRLQAYKGGKGSAAK